MIKLTINGQNAYFAVDAIRSVTPWAGTSTSIYKSLITIGDTEDAMFYVDQTPDEVNSRLPEGLAL